MRLIDADKLLGIYKKWIPQLLSEEDEGDRRGVETLHCGSGEYADCGRRSCGQMPGLQVLG